MYHAGLQHQPAISNPQHTHVAWQSQAYGVGPQHAGTAGTPMFTQTPSLADHAPAQPAAAYGPGHATVHDPAYLAAQQQVMYPAYGLLTICREQASGVPSGTWALPSSEGSFIGPAKVAKRMACLSPHHQYLFPNQQAQ